MNPEAFYTEQQQFFQTAYDQLKKQSLQMSMLRLAVFALTLVGIYFTYADPFTAGFIFVLGAVIFIILVSKHSDLIKKRDITLHKLEINQTELSALNGTFYSEDHGTDFTNGAHEFSHDIDLFGEYSFFFYLNRTVTLEGRSKLAELITSNKINAVKEKQEVVQELSEKVKWRQHFSALASLVKVDDPAVHVSDYITKYQPIFSKKTRRIPLLFSLASLIVIGLTIFQVIGFSLLTAWFFLGLGIAGSFVKRTQKIYNESGKAKNTFEQYYPLLQQIEEEEFTGKRLQSKQEIIQDKSEKASQIFKDFARILNTFDQRNNVFVAFLGNAFFLWDLRNACRVERWIETHKAVVPQLFQVISFFDAQNSLANFSFNHPNYVFPEILIDENVVIKAEDLGHPLLNAEDRVDNNFNIEQGKFFIVTGANMAGKSTFLRTVGLSLVMANCGLPVCASSFQYKPIKLITSMRTSDSLAQNESYFYAELKRLKYIIDLMKNSEYFIILDEILKGTNSKDKAAGSMKFVEKLVSFNSTGIIATHDISLCDLDSEYSEIQNYFFEAEIRDDELYFDYKLKNGVCKNMNASFLLKNMKII
jgi:hypothetical protein